MLTIVLIILGVLLVLTAAYLFLIAPGKHRRLSPFDRIKFAHRGLHTGDGHIPENSLAAFRRAKEAGFGVELDIQFTADHRLVVFHDATLERMCGIHRRVDSMTYDELKALPLQGSDQHIPLLEEALHTLGETPLVCEFKSYGAATDTELCEAATPILDEYYGPWCMESFNPFMVRWFKKYRPDVLRGLLSKQYNKADKLPGWQRAFLGTLLANVLCRPHFIAYCHQNSKAFGFRVCRYLFQPLCLAWTIKSAADGQKASAAFDSIIFEGYLPEETHNSPAAPKSYKNLTRFITSVLAAICFVAVVGSALRIAIPRLIQDSKVAERIEYGTPTVPEHFDEERAAEALEHINNARKTAGLNALQVDNGALASAAKTRAKELTVYFAHERPKGQSWETAFNQFAVPGRLRGENLASGQSTAAAVYSSWWHSQSHKENMMNEEYTYTYLACLQYEGTYYWVQLFR